MWTLKVKADVSKFLMGSHCIKHKITLVGYPVSYFVKHDHVLLLAAGLIFGKEKDKNAFCRAFKSSEKVIKLERNKDFLVSLMKQPKEVSLLYHPDIIWTEPDIISPDGAALWHLASFDKKVLDKVVFLAKEYFNGKILSFKQQKLKSLSLVNVVPNLTDKQKKALQLAVENGYYEVPRKITLKELAKMMKLSFSTYQVHLRRAERKIMPFMFGKL